MSKNTGTSELINYFDLGVNGDVGIAGSLDINTIANATTDTDTFLVSDTGIIKYRTGAQLLSDIGAQGLLTNPVTGTGTTNYLPKFTGSTTIGNSNLINDSNGNLGLAVTPSAWDATIFKGIQVGAANGFFMSRVDATDQIQIGTNAYYNADGNWKYINTNEASRYYQASGQHIFENAASGTAGNNITWTQAMTLTSGGNLILTTGAVSDNGARLQVSGTATISGNTTITGNLTLNGAVTRNINFYNDTNSSLNAQIQYDQISSNSGQLFFGTNNAGTFSTKLTIANTGAATFNLGSGEMRLNRTGTSEYLKLNTYYLLTDGNDQLLGSVTGATSIYAGNGVSPRVTITSTGITTFTAPIEGNGIVKVNSTDAQGANIGGVLTIGGNITNSGQTNTPFGFIAGRKTNSTVSNDDGYLAFGTRSSTIGTGTNYWQYISTSGAIRFLAYGAGALTTDASGNVTASSDERMKNIAGFYTNGLSAIKKIKPITFKWKEETELDTKEFYTGFSAQNLHEAIPESAGIMANGDLTIQDRPIMATIVNAINELNDIIQELQAKLDKNNIN